MQCPVCDAVALREIEKNGVLIDVCPSCKGVWLDRGELDKLMNEVHVMHKEYDQLQSYAHQQPTKTYQPQNPNYDQYRPSSVPSYPQEPNYNEPYNNYKKVKYDKYGRPYPYKKKKTVFNMLEDLFD